MSVCASLNGLSTPKAVPSYSRDEYCMVMLENARRGIELNKMHKAAKELAAVEIAAGQ